MLCEVECRALAAAHHMLMQDFEPRDALVFMEGTEIFTDDHADVIKNKVTRLERLQLFLRLYRRRATDLQILIEFFDYNQQKHISEFITEVINLSTNDPDQLRPLIIHPVFSREMLNRKLLLGCVPKRIEIYQRDDIVNEVVMLLEELSQNECFVLMLYGRAGNGKSVIASQALSKTESLIGVNYDSVIWIKDGGVLPKSTFDLFSDVLLMLRSEDDLQNFPCIDNITSVVLKKMIASALIDRPNVLFVFDDVVLPDTLRWAQELRLRCLITTRDVTIADVVTITCEYVEVPPLEVTECDELIGAYGFPAPETDEDDMILTKTIELTSGNPALLTMMCKACLPQTFQRLGQLNHRLEVKGLSSIKCVTFYGYKSYDLPLQRCAELLSPEDQEALANVVVMPPACDIPIKLWSAIIPVQVCSNDNGLIDDEVCERMNKLSRRGTWVTMKPAPMVTYRVDKVVNLFLRHVVDQNTISCAISTLKQRLLEFSNNNGPNIRPACEQYYNPQGEGDHTPIEFDYSKFMETHKQFYSDLIKEVQSKESS